MAVLAPQPGDPFLLFVYGTLKRGGVRHGPLAGQKYLGEFRTRPLYALYHLGGYPGLTAVADGQVVRGELYEVEGGLVAYLDRVEGAPSWFRLEPVRVEGVNGDVFAYFYQQDPGHQPRIPDGHWQILPGQGEE